MFTVCPSCSRQFRVHAYHLGAARGLVQCGFCGEQFDALSRLHDRPLTDLPSRTSVPSEYEPEPWFDVPGLNTAGENDRPAFGTAEQHGTATDEMRPDPVDYEADALSVVLEQDQPEARSGAATLLWSTGVVLLLIVLGIQLFWFNRDRIYHHHPRLVPVVGQVCEYFECRVFRELDTSRIELLNRDVREHPRFLNTLLINATIENRSAQILPYPDIRLVLYDTSGVVSGYRQFTPPEYLGENMVPEEGMKPDAPVHIILEVSGADEDAVSFEFHFVYNE